MISKINSSQKAYQYLVGQMNLEIEEFWAIATNSLKNLIAAQCLFRGTVNSCPVHPRDIFRFACLKNACSIIIAHSHPSQSPQPSKQDIALTYKIYSAGLLLEIPIDDHLILTSTHYYSFADAELGPYKRL